MKVASAPGMKPGIPLTSSAKNRLILLARLVVGGVFLYASVSKIFKPYHFAAAVQAYQLLPPALVALTAVEAVVAVAAAPEVVAAEEPDQVGGARADEAVVAVLAVLNQAGRRLRTIKYITANGAMHRFNRRSSEV